ncbi:galactose metabolism-related protein [Stygiomarasmius scandens]|uniref:Galactose metabolism-related protein n=1 Tax=Marasmiellus scandens TaxID=2682957 RepID=A0ABR1IR88_9AGAR
MGNSQSSSQHHRRFSASPRPRSSNASPAPGQPHRSLRQKKKSLELPDLAMLGITQVSIYEQNQKSASIPIPSSGVPGRTKEVYAVQPSDYIEKNLGRSQAQQHQQHQQQQQQRTQVDSNNNRGRASKHSQFATNFSFVTASDHLGPNAPPPSRELSPSAAPSRTPSVVRSSLPLVLPKALEPGVPKVPTVAEEPSGNGGVAPGTSGIKQPQDVGGRDSTEEMMVKISWHGGGNVVYLARAGDDDWKGRRKMEREDSTSSTFSTIIPLLPGTHHLRFLVDDHWRVADDLPTAVDDQGSLANYVAVGAVITGVVTPPEVPSSPTASASATGTTTPTKTSKHTHRTVNSNAAAGLRLTGADVPGEGLRRYHMGHSFWSANSTMDGDDDIPPSPGPRPTSPKTPPGVGVGSPPKPNRKGVRYTPRWTNEIPLELVQAAGEEEAYLNYQTQLQQHMHAQQQYNAYGHPHARAPVQISGFVPLPNIPPAPSLPRYLDKLILNTPVPPKAGVGVSVGSTVTGREIGPSNPTPSRGGRERVRSPVRDRDREREREIANRDRDRERDRDARRRERERRSLGMTSEEAMNMSSTPTLPVAEDLSASAASSSTKNNTIIDDTVAADDNSVLPVPSHVVLHHLCTSAIRNGVLAVGETVRYRQKVYVTSIYYKPAA